MQIIFLLIFSSLVFAQKGGKPPECDPKEAERECYTKLCSSLPDRLIPTDPDELVKAYTAFEYKQNPQVKADSDKLADLSTNFLRTANDALAEGKISEIASDLFSDPDKNFFAIELFFDGAFICQDVNNSCKLTSSDMEDYPALMKDLYKKWADETYVFRKAMTLPLKDLKKSLRIALDKVKSQMDSKEYKSEARKIDNFKSVSDYYGYSMDQKWFNLYKKRTAEVLAPYHSSFEDSLKIKIADLSKVDPNEAQLQTYRSCQLAHYMKSTLDQHATDEKFKLEVEKSLKSLTERFLPKLSAESAEKIGKELTFDRFMVFNLDANLHPYTPDYRRHKDGYKKPENSYDIIADLTMIQNSRKHVCEAKTLGPIDAFHIGAEIFMISKYSIANGFGNVISHEIGHWLSAQMRNKKMSTHSRKKLEKVRKCVKSFYPKEKRPSNIANAHKGDHLFVEEDFADWFASVAGDPKPGIMCELDKVLINLGVHNISSYVPQSGDSHSSLLFREITFRLNHDEVLPQSCRDLMSVYPESQPKKCDW